MMLAAGRGASIGTGAAGPAGTGVTRDGFGASAAARVSGGRAEAGAGFRPGGRRCRLGGGGVGVGRSFEDGSLADAAGGCTWRSAGRLPSRAGWSGRVSDTVPDFAAASPGPPGGAAGWAVAPVLVAGVGRSDGSRGDRALASAASCGFGIGGGCSFAGAGGLEAAGLIGGAVAAEVVWGAAGAPDALVPGRGWPASAAGGCDAEEEMGCPAGAGRPGGRASGGRV
jgi:hypothetical protein